MVPASAESTIARTRATREWLIGGSSGFQLSFKSQTDIRACLGDEKEYNELAFAIFDGPALPLTLLRSYRFLNRRGLRSRRFPIAW